MLPGLWSIVFGLGVFASYRLLPSATFWVATYYMIAGGVCLIIGQGPRALSPWLMVITFGVGQSIAAAILYWTWRGIMTNHDMPAATPTGANGREETPGRFAYAGLDRLFHERARLSILSSLVAHGEGVSFNDLKHLCH